MQRITIKEKKMNLITHNLEEKLFQAIRKSKNEIIVGVRFTKIKRNIL